MQDFLLPTPTTPPINLGDAPTHLILAIAPLDVFNEVVAAAKTLGVVDSEIGRSLDI